MITETKPIHWNAPKLLFHERESKNQRKDKVQTNIQTLCTILAYIGCVVGGGCLRGCPCW